MVHDSTLTAFADSQGKTLEQIETKTIRDLLAVEESKELIEAVGFAGESSTVAEGPGSLVLP